MKFNLINKQLVDTLYDKNKSGICILENFLDMDRLKSINKYIHENNHKFQEKREKYIDNNQKVALLYRGSFDITALNDTIFKEIVESYKNIRQSINDLSDIPFERGSSIEIKLIYYPVSALGVGIHKDLSSNVNLIVFFNLEGSTDIKTYQDKIGNNAIAHHIDCGDISLMRGPRLNEQEDIRPYHGIEAVYQPRTVLVIREINEQLEKETNKDNWRGF